MQQETGGKQKSKVKPIKGAVKVVYLFMFLVGSYCFVSCYFPLAPFVFHLTFAYCYLFDVLDTWCYGLSVD